MSTLAVVLIVIGAVLLALFAGGVVVARRRLRRPGFDADIAEADRALESARATDRGWDRELLHEAARAALAAERPGFRAESLHLVLVDDRPGVENDRAHVRAVGSDGSEGSAGSAGSEGSVRVILARESDGRWTAERVD